MGRPAPAPQRHCCRRAASSINGEPTENRLVTAQKGTLKVVLEVTRTRGAFGLSGTRRLGDRPAARCLAADPRASRCRSIRCSAPRRSTSGAIRGGEAPNVVAPHARAELLVRLVGPDERDARGDRGGGRRPESSVTFIPGLPPARAAGAAGLAVNDRRVCVGPGVHGSWGTCYQLGPGSIHVAHTPDEQISKAELREGAALYVRLVRTLLTNACSEAPTSRAILAAGCRRAHSRARAGGAHGPVPPVVGRRPGVATVAGDRTVRRTTRSTAVRRSPPSAPVPRRRASRAAAGDGAASRSRRRHRSLRPPPATCRAPSRHRPAPATPMPCLRVAKRDRRDSGHAVVHERRTCRRYVQVLPASSVRKTRRTRFACGDPAMLGCPR